MQQYEQDWLELGFRVAKARHYQTRWARSYREHAAIEAEGNLERRLAPWGTLPRLLRHLRVRLRSPAPPGR
jgi:hypothetical protein